MRFFVVINYYLLLIIIICPVNLSKVHYVSLQLLTQLFLFHTEHAERRRQLNASIYYTVAKIGHYFVKDLDILPLQKLTYQTDHVSTVILPSLIKATIYCSTLLEW